MPHQYLPRPSIHIVRGVQELPNRQIPRSNRTKQLQTKRLFLQRWKTGRHRNRLHDAQRSPVRRVSNRRSVGGHQLPQMYVGQSGIGVDWIVRGMRDRAIPRTKRSDCVRLHIVCQWQVWGSTGTKFHHLLQRMRSWSLVVDGWAWCQCWNCGMRSVWFGQIQYVARKGFDCCMRRLHGRFVQRCSWARCRHRLQKLWGWHIQYFTRCHCNQYVSKLWYWQVFHDRRGWRRKQVPRLPRGSIRWHRGVDIGIFLH